MIEKSLLRIMTCGSVDDGKSTLLGRLLHDTNSIPSDQIVTNDDYASLLDGLIAEQEQGITIDVAYRYFETDVRKFIVADTPGHEQYTRNMVTAASTADVAIILVDATKGLTSQTKRHMQIAALMRVRHMVLAVNKMDLVGYNADAFKTIIDAFQVLSKDMAFETVKAIPVAAVHGENIVTRSINMDWYQGEALLAYVETVPHVKTDDSNPFRLPVQMVRRNSSGERSYCGTLSSGCLSIGDEILDVKTGEVAHIQNLISPDGEVSKALTGDAVEISLDREIDISRGHILSHSDDPPKLSDQFQAHLIWFDADPMLSGRRYILQSVNGDVMASVTSIKQKFDFDGRSRDQNKTLVMNEIAVCNLSLQHHIAVDAYSENKIMGSFILIDPANNRSFGAGMIDFSLYRADNIQWQHMDITKDARTKIKSQKPCVIWLTGLSASGKTTIANALECALYRQSRHTYLLDGDNVRHGLNKDLGFTDADRVENIRRVAEVASLMMDAGLIVIASFISPFAKDRQMARDIIGDDFIEVFVDTPIEECIKRDPKGLYKKALAGEIPNFPGVDVRYEPPRKPDIHVRTIDMSIDECVAFIQKSIDF